MKCRFVLALWGIYVPGSCTEPFNWQFGMVDIPISDKMRFVKTISNIVLILVQHFLIDAISVDSWRENDCRTVVMNLATADRLLIGGTTTSVSNTE